REEAYDLVQPKAMESWETKVPFRELISADERITEVLRGKRLTVCSMKTITFSVSTSSSDVQASSKIKRGVNVNFTTRILLIAAMLLVIAGCWNGEAEPSDVPFDTFSKTVEMYDVSELAVPTWRDVDGVTYINDIL